MRSKRSACLCPSACLSLSVSFSWSVFLSSAHTLSVSCSPVFVLLFIYVPPSALCIFLSICLPLSMPLGLYVSIAVLVVGIVVLYTLGRWIEIWSALFVCLSFSACVLVYVCTRLSVFLFVFSLYLALLCRTTLSVGLYCFSVSLSRAVCRTCRSTCFILSQV